MADIVAFPPVNLITGFLGSGKTTLLRRLLDDPALSDTAVLINEFGEVGLDHHLLERIGETMVLLPSGCLCCTIRGELAEAIRDLHGRRERGEIPPFRRLVIESTGLADPFPILSTVHADPVLRHHFRVGNVITTVDAVNGMDQLDRQSESVKQAAMADRLVLTKTDLADAAQHKALEDRLRAINPAAPLVPVAHGAVAAERLFNAGLYNPAEKSPDVARWLKEEAYAQQAEAHHRGHDGHDHHHDHPLDVNRHDDHIRAFCLTYDRPVAWDRFVNWIEMLITMRGADLLRIKGSLNVAGSDAPVAIHGIQHLFHPPAVLPGWSGADRRSRIVFITRDLERAWLEQSMAEFLAEPAH